MKPRSGDSEGPEADTTGDARTVAVPGGSARASEDRSDTLLAQVRAGEIDESMAAPVSLAPLPSEAYQLGEEVARGGMGRVVRALDRRLDRVVALKLLLGDTPYLRARFAREAHITAGLQHPSIVPIYEAGSWPDGGLAYAMKLVSGRSLEEAIVQATSLAERLALLPRFIDVVDAVAYAHSQRVVHRDIKPSNIILGEFGETILIDWGVAKSLEEDEVVAPDAGGEVPIDSEASRLTSLGLVVGTPVYMPPEQAAGDTIDESADVYSLGAVLYHLLSGRLPYTGATPLAVLRKVVQGPPPALESVERHVPPELVAVVARAMSRAASERYRAAELAAELGRFTTGKLVAAYRYSARERMVRWLRRNRAPVFVAAAALAILVAVAGLSARRIVRERDRAQASDRKSRELVADQYAEQGRVLLLAGDRLRSIAYLLAAADAGARGPALDYLLARAATSLEQRRRDLVGHKGPVPFIAFDAAGERLFTVSDDGTARVWDAATGRELRAIRGPEVEVLGGELAPGGREILTFAKTGALQIWSTDGGDSAPIALAQRVTSARYSRDGGRVVAGTGDGRLQVFDRASRRMLTDVAAHQGVVRDVWLDAGGTHVWSAGDDGAVAIWTPDGRPLHRFDLARGGVLGLAASSDGSQLAAVLRDGAVAVWSGRVGTPPELLELGESINSRFRFTRLLSVFIAGGKRLVVPVNRSVQVFDLAAKRRLFSLTGQQGEVTWVTVSPDESRIATASADGGVRIWSAADGRLRSIFPTVDHVQMVAFASRGDLVATASYAGASIWVPAPDPPSKRISAHGGSIYSVRFRPDGKRLVTASFDKTVRTWDVASARELGKVKLEGLVTYASYDPTGRRIVIAEHGGAASVWDANTLVKVADLERRKEPQMAAEFSPDGRLVATAGDDGEVHLWDATSFARAATLSHPAAVNAFAFDPAGRRIVTVCQDGSARIWDLGAGRATTTFALDGPGLAAAFSPDGTRVIVAARQAARIHDADDGRLVGSLEGHQREVGAARLTADGLAVTGGYDHSTRIWDAATGRVLATYDVHDNWILALDIDGSGRRAATGDLDGALVVWELPREGADPAQLVNRLGSRLTYGVRDGLLVPRPRP